MKIKQINRVNLSEPVPVYDIELKRNNNFKLAAGVFVHNSKDIADALGGMTYNAHIKMKYYEDPLLIVPIENTFTGSSQIESYDQTVENFEKWVKEGDLHSNEKKRYSKNVREISGGSKEIHPPPENNNGS